MVVDNLGFRSKVTLRAVFIFVLAMLLHYCASFSEIIVFVQLPYFVGVSVMLLRFADILELSFYLIYSR